jgi:hypothetical protein
MWTAALLACFFQTAGLTASHWDIIGVKTRLEISCVVSLTLIFVRMTTFMDLIQLKWSSQDLVDVEEKCIKCSLFVTHVCHHSPKFSSGGGELNGFW